MKFQELVALADKGYRASFPEAAPLSEQCDEAGKPMDISEIMSQVGSDALARFIVVELFETFDEDATDEEQIREARRVVSHGIDDLQSVMASLQFVPKYTPEQLRAAADASYYTRAEISEDVVDEMFGRVGGEAIAKGLPSLRSTLKKLEKQFVDAGGRGVELADKLDAYRVVVAVLGRKPRRKI